MRVYRRLFKTNLMEELQYKGSYISGVICQIAFGLMYILLYTAFFEQGVPQDFALSQMVSYVWLGQAFFAMFNYGDLCKKQITGEIMSGNVGYQLIKPINLYDLWLGHVWFAGVTKAIVRCAPLLTFAFLLPSGFGLSLPVTFLNFLLFALSLIFGSLLIAVIKMFAYILSLYTLDARGVFAIIYSIFGFLGGLIIPLPLLPQGIQTVLNCLPFRYVADLPYRIYIGNVDLLTALWQVGIQALWIVALLIIGRVVLTKKSQKLVVQGG